MTSHAHKTLADRIEAAKTFKELAHPASDVYCDTMDDNMERKYGAFPERLYAIDDGKIVYQGGVGPFQYDVEGYGQWLQKYVQDNFHDKKTQ